MGPLDMRVGIATIMGCLKYGACFRGLDDQDDPVFLIRLKDEELLEAPDDSAFLQSHGSPVRELTGVYPPLALAEAYITEEDSAPRVRRLHLMVVDLHRRRRMADRVLRLLLDIQIDRCADECWKMLSPSRGSGIKRLTSFDMSLDMQWMAVTFRATYFGPHGQQNNPSGALMPGKVIGGRLDKCSYMAPLGVEHFFDAFCFDP